MSGKTFSQITSAALQLTEGERADLAAALLDSLEPQVSPEEAAAIEEAWIVEIERRMCELDADPSIAIPVEEVMAEAKKLLR
jgi:putative addiction module component (TIGR02574 family)